MKPISHIPFYTAMTALATATSVAVLAAAYVLISYAFKGPVHIVLSDW